MYNNFNYFYIKSISSNKIFLPHYKKLIRISSWCNTEMEFCTSFHLILITMKQGFY